MTAPASRPLDPERLDLAAFAGRQVAVLGLARSGVALCRFLADRGARVTAYDGREAEALLEAIESLGARAIDLRLGGQVDIEELLRHQDLVCTSPSVSSRYPTTEPRLREALAALEAERRVPVVSEVDLFLRLCPSRTVGVTGTKGKTTTSSLCAEVLARGPRPVVLGGNIGIPLIERLPELTPEHRVVLELSELQLPTLSRGTEVAVYTHVTQDHLDRHGTLEAYRAVKRRLAELLPAGGRLVLNAEDPVSARYADFAPRRTVTYRRGAPERGGVGVVDAWVVAERVEPLDGAVEEGRAAQFTGRLLPLDAIGVPGEHNVSNVLAAVAVGLLHAIEPAAIGDAVAAFRGVEHRLEPVALIDSVRYVNDSQGTQPDAVIAALRSFPRPLVLIAGGQDKGVPMEGLAHEAVARADAVVLMGESAPLLESVLLGAGHERVERAPDLEEAVRRADEIARALLARREGEQGSDATTATVLLSPAAASFDMFSDYAARGRAFKASVERLRKERAASGGTESEA